MIYPNFLVVHFYPLFFFNFWRTHFFDIVFLQLFEDPLLSIVFSAFWRSTGPGRYLIFCFEKFPVECRQNHVWEPIFGLSYDHIYENMYFTKVELDDTHG